MVAAVVNAVPCTGAIQSCCPKSLSPELEGVKGSNYYEPTFVPPREDITEIDKRDQGTPDDWVPRHPELVRLTGRHPFNVEPPLPRLVEHGFITPNSLHYVRNHGAVPRLDFEHKLAITGCVDNPVELSMEFLRSGVLPEVTIPVTLVCAGNRRKEENMIRQGLGFSWGAAAVSNAMWTGVWLKDLLEYAGIRSYEAGARHVCVLGADKLPNGYYGTSIRRDVALDPAADVLIAYKMNGEELSPDHGYPVRIIIPGYIGGRMVKWLTTIHVSEEESDNHYHFFDNRVLPPKVDAERALAEGWWYKPQYLINELNINSAVNAPQHAEVLPLTGAGAQETYTVSGYAYSGGGLAINRAEVSFDGGETWELCDQQCPEKPRHMGKYWCWTFWSYKVDTARLLTAKDIRCRAWQGQNTQPKDLTWNLLGMMNNCHFRVLIHPCRTESGALALRFEHPTLPGPQPGGWMVKTQEAAPEVKKPAAPVPPPAAAKTVKGPISKGELAKHSSEADCWIAVEGKVYDVTSFLADHPGGGDSITLSAGDDATEEFNALHSAKARGMLDAYYVGELATPPPESSKQYAPLSSPPLSSKAAPAEVDEEDPVALNPKKKISVKLIEREELTYNTRRLRFALPSARHRLGLPVGKHLFVSGTWRGEFVMRAYTPVTGDELSARGHVDLIIKVYYPSSRFPEGGKMSQLLDSLRLGDTIDMKGPLGEIIYEGNSAFNIRHAPRTGRCLGMMAGGTGITPMYQVAKTILENPEDPTKVWLLLANQSEDDILLRTECDALAAAHPDRFKVHYTVDRVVGDAAAWQGSTGFITEAMIAEHLPPAADDTLTFMCGPPAMLKYACIPNLQKLGYTDQHYFAF